MTPVGLPSRAADPAWQDWIDRFPRGDSGVGRARLESYRRALATHLTATPPTVLLSRDEADRLSGDLLLYYQQYQAEQMVAADLGLLNMIVAVSAFAGAIFFPTAAVPIAAIGVATGGIGSAIRYEQKRRQAVIESTLQLLRELSWRLRR